MELVSWNLNGLDERALDVRMEAALADILLGARLEAIAAGAAHGPPPDVVLLQEVTRKTFHAPLKGHLRAAGFELHPAAPPDRSYFELCAVRAPWRVVEHVAEPLVRTMYGRWLHRLRLEGPEGPLTVMTAHLDSGPEKVARAARLAQVRDLLGLMTERAVFAGDTNLRDAEWDEAARATAVLDGWEAAGAGAAHRFTWIGVRRKARFDRLWLTPDLTIEAFRTIGESPVAGLDLAPSDHLGLRARLRPA